MQAMGMAATNDESMQAFRLALFGETEAGRHLLEQYRQRLQERTVRPLMLDPVPLNEGGNNQIAAILDLEKAEDINKGPDRLAELTMPVLIANGDNDLTLGLVRSLDLLHRISNAQLVIYPKSGHGFLWQDASLFAQQVNVLLDTDAFDGAI